MRKDAEEYKNIITFMLTEPAFANIDTTYLKDVRNYINENGKITDGQKKAVNNIYIKFTGG
jgi:hypothetical protein